MTILHVMLAAELAILHNSWLKLRHAIRAKPTVWQSCLMLSMLTGMLVAAGISGFMEKPSGDALHDWKGVSKNATEQDPFEASMGIYVFKRDVLVMLPPTLETLRHAAASSDQCVMHTCRLHTNEPAGPL